MKQLIHGGRLLTAGRLDGAPADLLIDGDTIAAVLSPGESITADAKRIDATNCLLIPGLVNAHTHATVALCKAMVDRWSLERISRASAVQRAGRAGRTGPGRCIRLWSERDERAMPAFIEPEIHRVDLSGTLLALRLSTAALSGIAQGSVGTYLGRAVRALEECVRRRMAREEAA